MSDYSSQDQGIGGKGLIIAVVLIGLFILALAFMGGSGEAPPANPAAEAGAAETGAAESGAAATTDGAETAPAVSE